jgi:hypothetical protein
LSVLPERREQIRLVHATFIRQVVELGEFRTPLCPPGDHILRKSHQGATDPAPSSDRASIITSPDTGHRGAVETPVPGKFAGRVIKTRSDYPQQRTFSFKESM